MDGKGQTKRVLIGIAMFAYCLLNTSKNVYADFAFGYPENLGPGVNTAWSEFARLGLSNDGLSLAFVRKPPGSSSSSGWLATRPSLDAQWEPAIRLGEASWETGLKKPDALVCFTELMSPDGLEIYFDEIRLEGLGGNDIWMMTRETTESDWGPAVNLGPPVNTEHDDWQIVLSPDGLELYLCDDEASPRSGGFGNVDIWVSRRESVGAPWAEPVNLGPNVNSAAWDSAPYLSQDGLLLFFDSRRSEGYGSFDLYMSRRASLSDPWQKAVNLGPTISSSAYDESPQLAADGSTLYWGSMRPGGYGYVDVWRAVVLPIVDFNGDGRVDDMEVLTMMASWGTDDSLCDIGPTAFGDGLVDLQDLEVLAEYLCKDVVDPTLMAHWPMDETEGVIAYDAVGNTDGTIEGVSVPLWNSEGGHVGGALEFDGATCIHADPILNPSKGPFSILAWIKGGGAGQVIVSQIGGTDWLLADPDQGRLMVGHDGTARRGAPKMMSDVEITDGQWHRIAFVWDGTNRRLFVDDVLVAEDEISHFVSCSGLIQIGCGNKKGTGTFWTGLIDDVRIYNRVVWP